MKKLFTMLGAGFIIMSLAVLSLYFIGNVKAQSDVPAVAEEPLPSEVSGLPEIPGPTDLPQPPTDETKPPEEAMIDEVMDEATLQVISDQDIADLKREKDIEYSPEDFRDPFALPSRFLVQPEVVAPEVTPTIAEAPKQEVSQDPLLAYPTRDYRVTAILWGVKKPRAVLIAPNGKAYKVYPSVRVGREGAVIWAIREKEVVFLTPDESGNYKKGTALVVQMRN